MIIPSIDLMDGNAVQLVGGRDKALDAGDPRPLADRFALSGDVAIVDLDAALGRGSNAPVIRELLRRARCRVGGGIRDVKAAVEWLDAGAAQIVMGTAAKPEILRELPAQRVVAALDALDGEVVVEGWRTRTGERIADRMRALRGLVGGYLVTFVEREGRLGGTALDRVRELVEAAGGARVTIAGGVTTLEEIAELDQLGADAQVGMALYTGRMDFADAISAPIRSHLPDGPWPTVVVDRQERALALGWSTPKSLRQAVEGRRAIYHRGLAALARGAAASESAFPLVAAELDDRRHALRFTIDRPEEETTPGDLPSGWGPPRGLPALQKRLAMRLQRPPEGSYTARLLSDHGLLCAKLLEEAQELAEAEGKKAVTHEAADLLYFALVAMIRAGVSLDEVERELDRRALRYTRRPGDAKK